MIKGRYDRIFDIVNYLIMIAVCAIVVIPLIFILANSFSSPDLVYFGEVRLIPKGFTLATYKQVITYDDYAILNGFKNTIIYTFFGTLISMTLTFLAAYPLSRKDLKGRGLFMTLFVITMFFNGGLIPTFLVVKSLGLYNRMLGVILPGALSVYNMIIVRTYMQSSIPYELQEAAMIDGCSNFRLFLVIILPLCKPMIAIMVLFYAVGYWNSYYNALIYLQDEAREPIQIVLRRLFSQTKSGGLSTGNTSTSGTELAKQAEAMQYAVIVVAMAPILCIYPFLSKYFERGLMVGSLKG
ncbi:MAG: carbohydrate ABC transporter permease [Clostridia bacterium]|nr:carbohydrate ABC transporter permease [Clostridia bacterium]